MTLEELEQLTTFNEDDTSEEGDESTILWKIYDKDSLVSSDTIISEWLENHKEFAIGWTGTPDKINVFLFTPLGVYENTFITKIYVGRLKDIARISNSIRILTTNRLHIIVKPFALIRKFPTESSTLNKGQ